MRKICIFSHVRQQILHSSIALLLWLRRPSHDTTFNFLSIHYVHFYSKIHLLGVQQQTEKFFAQERLHVALQGSATLARERVESIVHIRHGPSQSQTNALNKNRETLVVMSIIILFQLKPRFTKIVKPLIKQFIIDKLSLACKSFIVVLSTSKLALMF